MRKMLLGMLVMLGTTALAQEQVVLDRQAEGPRFDGIGIVNGGGATSVLLKDYPEPQRSQILDMVYRPKFGASVSALLVEIPGDGNSTQGSMPSHRHTRDDLNYHRGYTWWVMSEAKRRNPRLSLDGAAWSAPGWIGNGRFWSQDCADYYASWLKGLRSVYGLEMDAIGCRNEAGVSYDFAKLLRRTLNDNGFRNVRLHAFDNWPKNKMDFVRDLLTDKELADAIDILSGHVFYKNGAVSQEVQDYARQLNKPIWNSEDHVYLKGFDCLIEIVRCFNQNYIKSGATKVVNWYDIAGVYPMEPYSFDPPMVIAREPWSGHYQVRQNLWGYAHYGQFSEVGWHYVNGGCRDLQGGGSMVTMQSASGDYSVIIETKDASAPQQLCIRIKGGLKDSPLCAWRSNKREQFERLADITPADSTFTIALEPRSVYSLSTTRGQQKGTFADIPASKPFPMPYTETFDEYTDLKACGYLPRYTADIAGAFELAPSPDGKGLCLHQAVPRPTISWAPDWQHYTILGDSAWTDYEVSADVWLNPTDTAGIMGRICHVGTGWGFIPKGYLLQMGSDGMVRLVVVRGKRDKKKVMGDAEQQAIIKAMKDDSEGGEKVLAEKRLKRVRAGEWHNLRLRFRGDEITAFVDGRKVLRVTDRLYPKGMAGLYAGRNGQQCSMPYYDNLSIKSCP